MYPHELFLGINLYGVSIAVGLLFAFGVLFLYGKRTAMPAKLIDFTFYNGIIAIILGFGSAALFQAFYNYLDTGVFRFGGITFIGGLIGGAVCFLAGYFILGKKWGSLTAITKVVPCSILIAHAFGRIGCLMLGCCHGAYLGTDPVAGGIYMRGVSNGWGYYVPVQLYESLFLFVTFAVTSYFVIKKDFKFNLETYLISYGVFRFAIEYLRGDERGTFVGSLSPSQFWSIIMVVMGVGLIFLRIYQKPIKAWLIRVFNKSKTEEGKDEEA